MVDFTESQLDSENYNSNSPIRMSDIYPIIEMKLSDFEYSPAYNHPYFPPQYNSEKFKDRDFAVVEENKYICACYKCKAIYLFENKKNIESLNRNGTDKDFRLNLLSLGYYASTPEFMGRYYANDQVDLSIRLLSKTVQEKGLQYLAKSLVDNPYRSRAATIYRVLDYISEKDQLAIFNARLEHLGKAKTLSIVNSGYSEISLVQQKNALIYQRAYSLEMRIIYNKFLEIASSNIEKSAKQAQISNLYLIPFYIFNSTPSQLRMLYEIEKYINKLEDNVAIRYLASNSYTPGDILEEIAEIGGYEQHLIKNVSFPLNSILKLNLSNISRSLVDFLWKTFFEIKITCNDCTENVEVTHSIFGVRRAFRDLTYEQWSALRQPIADLKNSEYLCTNPLRNVDYQIIEHVLQALLLNNNAKYIWENHYYSKSSFTNTLTALLSEEQKTILFLSKP